MAKTRTPEEEQATKEKLFQISARTFLREGYSKTTMKMLAEEAGCTTGKFYSNFSGKEEILTMLMETLLHKNCEEAIKYSGKYKDAYFGITVFFSLLFRGSMLYENLREIYREGLQSDASKEVAESMLYEILKAEKEEGSLSIADAANMLALRVAVGMIPDLLKDMDIIPDEDKENVFLILLLRTLGVSDAECERQLQILQKEEAHIRDKAYDSMVRILEGKKRRK